MGGYMVAGHSGAFYTPETGMEFPCETAGSAPEVSITVRGALFMPGGNHASKAGRTVDICPPPIEWTSADAESWGLYLLF